MSDEKASSPALPGQAQFLISHISNSDIFVTKAVAAAGDCSPHVMPGPKSQDSHNRVDQTLLNSASSKNPSTQKPLESVSKLPVSNYGCNKSSKHENVGRPNLPKSDNGSNTDSGQAKLSNSARRQRQITVNLYDSIDAMWSPCLV